MDYTNIRCYTCDEKCHFSRDCPRNKEYSKENKKKRHHAHTIEDDEPAKKRTREDSSSDEEYVLWAIRIQPMMKKNFLSISTLDKKGCSCDWWRRRDTLIYEDLFNNVGHEQDKHRSSTSYDGEKHTVKDSNNSYKNTKIKRDSTKQTKINV